MKFAAVLTSLLLLSSAALAQSVGEKSGVNSTPGVAPKSADFVTQVAISDMFEIESSKLANERADASSKTFAARMIKDHTGTSSELKAIASKAKFDVPAALDSAHQSKFDKLKGMQGADFDREYDSMQVDAHKDAIDLFERYAKGGDNADLKAFASRHLPHLREHLSMAQALSKPAPAKAK
jgi:putative membrane protein